MINLTVQHKLEKRYGDVTFKSGDNFSDVINIHNYPLFLALNRNYYLTTLRGSDMYRVVGIKIDLNKREIYCDLMWIDTNGDYINPRVFKSNHPPAFKIYHA